jgi:ADP-ribosylglycohydrolase
MWGAINGEKKEVLLSKNYFPLLEKSNDEPLSESIQAIAAGSFKKKNPPDIKGTTYATDCLEAALWAFYHTTDFEHGCLKAVNLGDDADTTGAVFGQIEVHFTVFKVFRQNGVKDYSPAN